MFDWIRGGVHHDKTGIGPPCGCKGVSERDAFEVDIEIEPRIGMDARPGEKVARLRPTLHCAWKQIDHENDGAVALSDRRTGNWSESGGPPCPFSNVTQVVG
jgi:hypothetical protein